MVKIKPKKCANTECGKEFTPRRLSTERVCSFPCSLKYAEQKRIKKEKKEGLPEEEKGSKYDNHPTIYLKENKKRLQAEINTIVRSIDKGESCIDCGLKESAQWDAGHFYSRGNRPALSYHLHNIFKQACHCNNHSEGNKRPFLNGIEEVYGEEYRDYVDCLKDKYERIPISAVDYPEAIKEARKIIRELKTADLVYPPKMRIQLREKYNNRLGIY